MLFNCNKANRKGVELTMNVIVMAAIALLVLLILAFFLMRGFGGFNKGTDCVAQGGICHAVSSTPSPANACPDTHPITSGYTCGASQKCCVKLPGAS
ncbi:MAG TPA: hypothetical protein VEC16_01920 [Alphaproteobacteria bacterium]|nr:hypothetical protein [Alphaproteobacteria bacterium]